MRVLFWSETFWPRIGGVETLAAGLLPALRSRRYEFAVITWEDIPSPDRISYQGITIYRFPFFSGARRGLEAVTQSRNGIAEIKKRFAPDLVHINSFGRSVLFHLNTGNVHPAPVLVTLHQALADQMLVRDSLPAHLLRTADWVNTCSNSVLRGVRELVPHIIPRSSVIYNSVPKADLKRQLLPFNPPSLLCVGRLVPEKGFDSAITAFATALRHFPETRLIIAGDGPEHERLSRQAVHLGLGNDVEFVGTVPAETVPHLINKATVVVMPSANEGFGLVALEAAMLARPVIATRVGGLPEIVLHGKTGFLVERNSPQQLADTILFLLRMPQIAVRFGEAARERAERSFNFSDYVDAYDHLYSRLATNALPAGAADPRSI